MRVPLAHLPATPTRGFLEFEESLHGKGGYVDALRGVRAPRHRDSVNPFATVKRSN